MAYKDKDKFKKLEAFVEAQIGRYAAYHQSKEAMAYAGITLFGGITGTGIISSAWPPKWGEYTLLLAIIASTFLWAAFLIFLRFQLTRRRWAALRVAGCERLLAAWIQKPPSSKDLELWPSIERKKQSIKTKIANFLWGSKEAVHAVKIDETIYPIVLVMSWLDQEKIGTDALKHERLILISGWALYIILVISTWVKYCNSV